MDLRWIRAFRCSDPLRRLCPRTRRVWPEDLAPAGSDANKQNNPKQQPKTDFRPFIAFPICRRVPRPSCAFLAAAENDFAARMQWSVSPKFNDENHPPVSESKVRLPLV